MTPHHFLFSFGFFRLSVTRTRCEIFVALTNRLMRGRGGHFVPRLSSRRLLVSPVGPCLIHHSSITLHHPFIPASPRIRSDKGGHLLWEKKKPKKQE